jgi:HAD superfamily hydrolase (TIGR01493 family)
VPVFLTPTQFYSIPTPPLFRVNYMKVKKLISFDLDSTLIEPTFTTFVWEIGIPELYAKKNNVSLSEATSIVKGEYDRVGEGAMEWYDIAYWFRFFELAERWQDLMEEHRDKVRPFPEVEEVMEELGKSHDLIIVSNAAREFIEMEVKEAGIEAYFTRIFSVTSDFGQVKKTPECYVEVLKAMGATPADTVHVGDHYEFDYLIPKKLGITSYFLNRHGNKPKDRYTIKDLTEFKNLVKNHKPSL